MIVEDVNLFEKNNVIAVYTDEFGNHKNTLLVLKSQTCITYCTVASDNDDLKSMM